MIRLEVTLLLVTLLQWGSLLEVAANSPKDCAPRELRCELLCHVVELGLQCAKCRSRAPVRFGKRVPETAVQPSNPMCCGHLFKTLLLRAAARNNV
ncbi:hypothetical protein L9F63_003648 [Diploptera punctata]|uniref:Secreted protein n=1 Tax=Diploptera punctata TaxID=6984 RepID=A0AAD7ZJX7_DIPPU|nr:hypothetical protein L9F63_003648 [Diploptera punctata]